MFIFFLQLKVNKKPLPQLLTNFTNFPKFSSPNYHFSAQFPSPSIPASLSAASITYSAHRLFTYNRLSTANPIK